MKRLFSKLSHVSTRAKLAYGAALALLVVALPAVAMAGFSPDRTTKVYNGPGTPGFNYVTFNSFTNVPGIGDERNFFNGQYPSNNTATDPLADVKSGDVLTLDVYVHNDADPSLNTAPGQPGIAKDTTVRVALPNETNIAKNQQATAYISASNAKPGTVADTLDFSTQNGAFFALQYVKGSAHVQGNYINTSLPDSVVTTGAKIGTNALDGNLKGCFQQEVLVTLKVKVLMPEYHIEKHVRTTGSTTWDKTVTSKPGDTDQWLITFNNNGETPLNAVNVVDQVPAGLTVVPGSVKLVNGNYPNGYTFPDSAIQDNGRTVNVNIGNYNPGINAFVIFATKIDNPDSNVCGTETLTNKAFATPQGFGAIWDTAVVNVDTGNVCNTTTPSYACTAFDVNVDNTKREVTSVSKFKYTVSGGATFKNVVLSWGDSSQAVTTDATNIFHQSHQYSGNGPFTITAAVHFNVPGQTTDGVSNCTKQVSFTTTPTTPPTQLVNTGPGQVVGLFAVATIAGAFAHRLFLSRKFSN